MNETTDDISDTIRYNFNMIDLGIVGWDQRRPPIHRIDRRLVPLDVETVADRTLIHPVMEMSATGPVLRNTFAKVPDVYPLRHTFTDFIQTRVMQSTFFTFL